MKMNIKVILSNLREAQEQLAETIEQLSNDPDYAETFEQLSNDPDYPDYVEAHLRAEITHIYDHINTAWNARYTTDDKWRACEEDDFFRWRAFPTDIDLGR
jgi:hypothetical protein